MFRSLTSVLHYNYISEAMELVPSLISEDDDLPVYMHMMQRQEQMITPKICCQQNFVYP